MPGSRSSGAAITSGAVIVDKVAAADAAEALEVPACWVLRTAPGEDLPGRVLPPPAAPAGRGVP